MKERKNGRVKLAKKAKYKYGSIDKINNCPHINNLIRSLLLMLV